MTRRTVSLLFALVVLQVGCNGPTPLAVTSVVPNNATSRTVVTIYGTGFRAGATVTFDGVAAEVLSVSSTSIRARTPELAPGRVDVVVTNTNGDTATLAGGITLAAPAPFAVGDYFPKRGYGDMLFGILGTGLIQGTTVKFGGVAPLVAFTGGPFGILNGLLPPHDPGPVDITVTHPDGRTVTISNGLTYVPPPVLTASPVTVAVGGSVTVSWVADPITSIDYICLFRVGAQPYEEIAAQRVTGNSGSMTFTAPSSPGLYHFRYLPTEGQWDAMAASSNVVTVTPAVPARIR